jgi:hypothetical protein
MHHFKKGNYMTTFTTEDREQAYKSIPLTDKQIMDIYYDLVRRRLKDGWQLEFARQVEKAHNISWK